MSKRLIVDADIWKKKLWAGARRFKTLDEARHYAEKNGYKKIRVRFASERNKSKT